MLPESFSDDVKKLLESGIGDRGRLEHILSSLEKGKKIYNSDRKYIENLLNKTNDVKKSDALQETPNSQTKSDYNSPVQFNQQSTRVNRSKSPKPKRIDSIPYGISYHISAGSAVKIHHNSCRFYRNASQEGSTKWIFKTGYQNARQEAQSVAYKQSNYWKHAQCCLNGIINRSVSFAIFISIIPFLGLVGNLIVRDYYPTLGQGLKYFGLVYGILVMVFYLVNNVSN